jgi:hypothetical protein
MRAIDRIQLWSKTLIPMVISSGRSQCCRSCSDSIVPWRPALGDKTNLVGLGWLGIHIDIDDVVVISNYLTGLLNWKIAKHLRNLPKIQFGRWPWVWRLAEDLIERRALIMYLRSSLSISKLIFPNIYIREWYTRPIDISSRSFYFPSVHNVRPKWDTSITNAASPGLVP